MEGSIDTPGTDSRRRGTRAGGAPWRALWWALVLGGVVVLNTPVPAHHSFARFYLEDDTIEIEGDVVEFQFRSPHAWVHVIGQDMFGRRQTYAAEWSNPSRLERDGVTKTTLRPGDNVRIWAAPNRDPRDNRVHLKRIERRSDGWTWGREGRGQAR